MLPMRMCMPIAVSRVCLTPVIVRVPLPVVSTNLPRTMSVPLVLTRSVQKAAMKGTVGTELRSLLRKSK